MKRDQQRSQENRKHQQTIGGNIRVVTLPVPKEAEA
jgi:hypothetical protein